MDNKIKQEVNKIKLPSDLHERSKMGVLKAKSELQRTQKKFSIKYITIAAGLLVTIAAYPLFNHLNEGDTIMNANPPIVTEEGGVEIPMISLPDDTSGMEMDMIGLIVYDGKIYTQTDTEINVEAAKALVGEKLGKTKGNIDEWSNQEAYAQEFASTIGQSDVYSVKGYSRDFRIMTYEERDGEIFAEFYENLNGITVNSGADVFGKLNMIGNISTSQYRTYNDWNNSIDQYHPIADMETLNLFVEKLNDANPLVRSEHSDPIGDYRTDDGFRELTIKLNDGSNVRLVLLKDGYIYYGWMSVYFKMEQPIFSEMWNQLQ